MRKLIIETEARNPYIEGVKEAQKQLDIAIANNAGADTIKELQMFVWAKEHYFDGWHGENVFPLEWALGKLSL